jgi:hypothetical protein
MAEIQPLDLNRNTVFILGAGASKPYGLPLGLDLKQLMLNNLSNPGCQHTLIQHGFETSLVEDFVESLSGTYHPTIDIFLEKKKKFRSLGSYLIAYTLLPMETRPNLFPQRDWYGHLYNVIDFEHELPHTDKITFVSLNYDRSLEHFLTRNIHYNCPDHAIQNAQSKLKLIKIVHAHGSLGPYPKIPYGNIPDHVDVLNTAANGIRIVSDRLQDSDDFKNAQFAIGQASNIVFIGFGYDPTTLKILMSSATNLDNQRILGTAFKLSEPERNAVSEFFNNRIEIAPSDWKANGFIKAILPVIS